MMRQRYVILLYEIASKQVWLGSDNLGRIGSCDYKNATRYDSWRAARWALENVQRTRRLKNARILGTLEDAKE